MLQISPGSRDAGNRAAEGTENGPDAIVDRGIGGGHLYDLIGERRRMPLVP